MAKITFDGMTMEQAKCFAHWYEGQGEQDAGIWFEIHNLETPMTNMQAKPKWMEINEKEQAILVHCK